MRNSTSQRERETETETEAKQTTAVASSNAGTSLESNYQVFLSFKGDTRKGFTNVLYHGLADAGISVFLDDKEIPAGTTISSSLERAIKNSKIYIPVFSQNYASSQWCLYELKRIVKNTLNSEGDKVILPIFLDVTPKDVKLKTSLYCDAIQKLKCEKRLSNEQVNEWKNALIEVGAIKGWEVEKYEGYGELSKLVGEEVVKKLKTKYRSVPRHFVRIDDRVSKMRNMLEINSPDVRFIRIHGMGGIGKTTLAKVVFNELYHHFGKCCCFLDDVKAELSSNYGSVELQKKLLLQIGVQARTSTIFDVDDGMKTIEQALCNKKVLIVLDNVDDGKQVEKLIGRSTLYSGSRILITSRNKDNWQTTYPISNYEMEVMSNDHALELFSKYAFNNNSPPPDYNHLSREVVLATGRLPLTLEVIGSLLHGNHSQIQWRETLRKLERALLGDVFDKLMISYETLDLQQRQIFLDIACFFVGEDKMSAIYVWEDREFSPYFDINFLINKSLVKIVENNKFWMHDQLRSLGRKIVREENENYPEQRSRLWICEEILDALGTNKTKEKVEALDLDLRKSDPEVVIRSEEIERFKRLKYLKLKGGVFTGNLANSLTDLSWISWSHPHPTSNPTNMHLKKVVVLQFSENDLIDDSKLQSLIMVARKLKVLSLNGCNKITRTPDFSECLNLESLNVNRCSKLREIDSSIGKLKCLIDMKIAYCHCLEFLPEEIGVLEKLKHFTVQQCDGVKRLPESIWKLKSLREVHFLTGWDFYSVNS